jgi:hypothetical protein
MLYVGLDVHEKYTTIQAMDGSRIFSNVRESSYSR